MFKRLAGADEVKVLPNSKHLFHLDMAMSVLKPGTVALIEPVDGDALAEDNRRVIAEIRQALAVYGFHIVRVPTLADWVNTFKSPVNVIPYTHRGSGRLSALVPQFEDRVVTSQGKPVSIRQEIRRAYKDAGVEAIFAASDFYRFAGNFHCAILPVQ